MLFVNAACWRGFAFVIVDMEKHCRDCVRCPEAVMLCKFFMRKRQTFLFQNSLFESAINKHIRFCFIYSSKKLPWRDFEQ